MAEDEAAAAPRLAPPLGRARRGSLAALVERGTFASGSDLRAAVPFLAGRSIVEDRRAAAYALPRLPSGSGSQTDPTLTETIGLLRDDPSYPVRHLVSDTSRRGTSTVPYSYPNLSD